jgi:hypothetical protein
MCVWVYQPFVSRWTRQRSVALHISALTKASPDCNPTQHVTWRFYSAVRINVMKFSLLKSNNDLDGTYKLFIDADF